MNGFGFRCDQQESESRETEGPGACWESKLLKYHVKWIKIYFFFFQIDEDLMSFVFMIHTLDITFAIAEPRYAQKNAVEKQDSSF